MNSDAKYMVEQIGEKLTGWTISNPIIDDSDEHDQRFGFIVKKGHTTKQVWVDCDPESNHAGWLAILA